MITEDQLELLAIQWFQETGWTHVPGAVITPEGVAAEREDFRAVVLKGRLAEALRLNPKLPESAVEEVRRRVAMPGRVVHLVTKPEHPSPVQSNRAFHRYRNRVSRVHIARHSREPAFQNDRSVVAPHCRWPQAPLCRVDRSLRPPLRGRSGAC